MDATALRERQHGLGWLAQISRSPSDRLWQGLLVGPFGGDFNKAAALMTGFALLSIVAMAIGRETRGEPLPT